MEVGLGGRGGLNVYWRLTRKNRTTAVPLFSEIPTLSASKREIPNPSGDLAHRMIVAIGIPHCIRHFRKTDHRIPASVFPVELSLQQSIKGKVVVGTIGEQQIVRDSVDHLNAYRRPIAAESGAEDESRHHQAY